VLVSALLLFALADAPASAQIVPAAERPLAPETLDLLKAEILDTVTLDKPVHFTTPAGQDVMAPADLYRVEAVEATTLRLTPDKGNGPVLIQALSTRHLDPITMPIAVMVPEAEDILHVVLLLPGGKALEAVGSLTAVRARAGVARLLSPDQLHQALLRKQAASSNPNARPHDP
jgi:hypothetical protein